MVVGGAPSELAVTRERNPWAIALVVAVASFMEVLDTTIANVALPYIAGGLGVSGDEASWVVTTYLVSNAIILTASTFLVRRFGRKTFFIGCLSLFTLSSVLCAVAWNLQALLLFRILQGFAGGGMVPVAQSILADTFPPEKRGQAFALFGVAVVVAPVVGPTLGGWLADNISWHWCFLINGPVGAAAVFAIAVLLPQDAGRAAKRKQDKLGFDIVGFVLVATFLGSLELMCDRGLEDDWFGSRFIVTAATICALAFIAMIPWEASRRDPIIDIRMVGSRQFGACFLVMLATGAILLGTTQFLPQLVQTDLGYTATWAGMVLSPGGIVTMIMMFVTGRLLSKVQPKYLIVAGASIIAASMFSLTAVYRDIGFWYLAESRMLLGIGLPLIFLSITAASYDGLQAERIDQASALINVARNTGGSLGVALISNVQTHREQFHQGRLVEHVVPSHPGFQATVSRLSDYLVAHGSTPTEAPQQAIAWIGRQVQSQASFLAFMDAFWVLMLIALAAIPLALALRKVRLGAPGGAAH